MASDSYDLKQYVADLRRITREETDERRIVERLEPLARRFAEHPELRKDAYSTCNDRQGFSLHLLHEEDDHSNAVFLFGWLPGRGTPAHNHKTWGVVVGIKGEETEIQWRRRDDGSRPGYANLAREAELKLRPGDTASFLGEDIHTVQNDTDAVTLSLHTYGKHINYTNRSEFDPEAKTEKDYVLTVE